MRMTIPTLNLMLALLAYCAGPSAAVAAEVTDRQPLIALGVRTPAPALTLEDSDGKARNLSDLRGKVVLVNFWATWCEPCRDEMPSMQALKRKLAGRPFEVLAVNLAESDYKVSDYVRRFPVDFTIPLDRNSAARRDWNVKMLPTSFVVAPDGTIRYSVVGELNWADDFAAIGLLRLVPK